MHFIELDPAQHTQLINATAVYRAWEQARKAAEPFKGMLFWRQVNGRDYLIRTSAHGAQKSVGLKNAENQHAVEKFNAQKAEVEDRLKSLSQQLRIQERLNRALRVGRAPAILVDTVHAITNAGLSDYFTVVGTHALYAYEAAAGAMFPQSAMATIDIDLLFDATRRMQFFSDIKKLGVSFLNVLKKADKSFKLSIDDGRLCTAVNDKGFEIDIIRRVAPYSEEKDPRKVEHPLRLSEHEEDFYPVQASMGERLMGARPFEQVVVASNGMMVKLRTIHPLDFARIKRELASRIDREAMKAPKDRLQAEAIEQLVKQYLPQLDGPPAVAA